jgi:hypothetical protein
VVRGLEAHTRRTLALAKLDELVRLRFREECLGFIAEVFDRLEADRRDEEAAENGAGELFDFLDRPAFAFDFGLERRRGEIDAGRCSRRCLRPFI